MLDILCVGDSKLDIFIQIPNDNPHFDLDKEKNKLLISYGEKISVDKHILEIGGNATNTAVGISRLGFNVGLCAEIGNDEFSQKILNRLTSENVNKDLLLQTLGEETSFSVAIGYKGERTLFTEHATRKHEFNFEKVNARYIYLTSLGPIWEKAYEKVLEFVKKTGSKLAFNPGTLQIEKKDRVIMDILEKTDYLFLNKQEAEEILYGQELNLKTKNDENIKKLLFGLKSFGVKNAIITDSDNGSYAQDANNNLFKIDSLHTEVVEKTGAGDAYASGFLGGILSNNKIGQAMEWGSINSASVVTKVGAQQGLLKKNEIEEKLRALDNFSTEDFN